MKRVYVLIAIVLVFIGIFLYNINNKKHVSVFISGILNGNLVPFEVNNEEIKKKGGILHLGSFALSEYNKIMEKGHRFLWLDNGDNLSGTPVAYYTQGRAIIGVINNLPITAMLIGNREFDFGKVNLFNIIKNTNYWIGSNILSLDGQSLPFLKKKVLKSGGKRILILGLTPSNTPQLTLKKNIEGLKFLDVKDMISKYNDDILRANIVFIITQFTNREVLMFKDLLSKYKNTYFFIIYNIYDKNDLRITKLSDYLYIVPHFGISRGEYLEKLDFDILKGKIANVKYNVLEIDPEKIIPDERLFKIVSDYQRKIDVFMNKKIGEAMVDLLVNNFFETAIGDMVCDVLKKISGADIALINSNGMRIGFKKGDITHKMLFQTFPFDNNWVLLELSGKSILKIIERPFEENLPIFQIAGIRIKVDKSKDLKITNIFMEDGSPFILNKKYKVVTNSFLSEGGDGYIEFLKGKRLKTGKLIRDVISKYIKDLFKIFYEKDNRIIIIQ